MSRQNPSSPTAEDLSGRKNLLRSLSSGWIFSAAQILSGFVLPRLISDRLGQESLGVWDFGWAVVSYFALLQGGIVSSVNRYVAKYRATGETANLNIAVNSVNGMLKSIAAVVIVLSVVVAWGVPRMMENTLAGLTGEARWVVLLLGLTAAIEIQGAVYGGVLTGCHRWTVHNGIKSGTAMFGFIGGVVVIWAGGNIAWLAGVMLAAEVAMRLAQSIACRKACPELRFSFRHFHWKTAMEMTHFGGKTYVITISQMLVNQTASVLVASTCGVAALAIFSRPRSLVRAYSAVIANNASVVVPVVSALDAEGRRHEVAELTITATRYAVFACLPAMLVLSLIGGEVVRVWMGNGYVDSFLIAIFAISGLIEACHFPLHRVLMGLNRHGKVGLWNLGGAVVSAALAAVAALGFKGGMHAIALAVAVPTFFVNLVLLPWQAARILELSYWKLMAEVWTKPLCCCGPALLLLLLPNRTFGGSPEQLPLVQWTLAALVSLIVYWRFVLPPRLRNPFRTAS